MLKTDAFTLVQVSSLIPSFVRHIRAENKSANTIDSYREAAVQFSKFLETTGMPSAVSAVSREHVEMWITRLLEQKSASTANNRFRGLRQFFRWAIEEGEIRESPMLNLKPPTIPEKLVPVLSEEQLDALIKTCTGGTFADRRDNALIHMFIGTGARKSEVANVRWAAGDAERSDLDLDTGVVLFRGKGSVERLTGLGKKTVRALDRYVRVRSSHPSADSKFLWLGKRGRLNPDGCARAIQRKAQIAGIKSFHVHQLRHTYAHFWLLDGGGEESLMRTVGWKSREMVGRYAASAGTERALIASRSVGLGSRY